MTNDDVATTAQVRPGTMLDVNPVGRLLHQQALSQRTNGASQDEADAEAAAVAARLLLLHVVLERGMLVVAERSGTLVAASIWLPGDAAFGSEDLPSLLRRELRLTGEADVAEAIGAPPDIRDEFERSMADLATDLVQANPDLVLYAVVVSPEVERRSVVPLARRVVEPALAAGRPVMAIALDQARARLLQAVGFAERSRVQLGAGGSVWIGAIEPAVHVLA